MRRVALLLVAALALAGCGSERETAPGSTESTQPAAPPNLALVVCQPEGPPRVETPTVKPQPDGVHIRFVNETGKDLSFAIDDPSGGGMGASAPQGSSTEVVDLHPGTVSIACYDAFIEDGSKVAKTALEIVDEDGLWIPARLTCARRFTGFSDYAEGARGKMDPLEAAREALDGYMQAGDIVEPAGYAEAESLTYRLVREGEVLAIVELRDDGAGGWLTDNVTGCSSLEP